MIFDDLKIVIFYLGLSKDYGLCMDYGWIMDDHLAHASASIVEDVLDLVQLCHPVLYLYGLPPCYICFFCDPVIACFGLTPCSSISKLH